MKKILCAAAVAMSAVMLTACSVSPFAAASVETLKMKNLQNTITISGRVVSAESCNVYSSTGYPVREINVKEGDAVKAGDVLCLLDSADLADQIAIKELSLESSSASAYLQLSQSEKRYEDAKLAIDRGDDAEILNAKSAADSAKAEFNRAKTQYDEALRKIPAAEADMLTELNDRLYGTEWNKGIAENKFNSLVSGKTSEEQTKINGLFSDYRKVSIDLKEARTDLKYAIAAGSDTSALSSKVKKYEKSYDDKKRALEEALSGEILYKFYELDGLEAEAEALEEQIKDIISSMNGEISSYKIALDSAKLSVERAELQEAAAKRSAGSRLDELQAAVEQSRLGISEKPQLLELDILKKKLKSCTVTAPVSGVVTAVKTEVGSIAGGVLFTIEDTENLIIKASVQEYDISGISEGQRVSVASDALPGESYDGVLEYLAVSGVTNTASNSGEIIFPAEVSIKNTGGLKIGMSAKLKIISAERADVFAVRYDMLSEDEDGKTYIFAAEDDGKGGVTAKKIEVATGMETNLEIEISGEGLTDGMKILSNASSLTDGQPVLVTE